MNRMRRTLMIRAVYACCVLMAVPAAASPAQEVRGVVRDSATQGPVAGAVLLLSNASGATLARKISDAQGRFSFAAEQSVGAARLRAIHIGFQPRDLTVPADPAARQTITIAMQLLGTMLDTVHVVASDRCGRGADAARAAALLEQAREGVLATDVAAESKPANMVRLAYVRHFDASDHVDSQSVHRVANRSIDSFRAVYTAAQFVRSGFMQDSAGFEEFFGPDARTIVDPAFASGYCFTLAHDRSWPMQVGLRFTPAFKTANRVDVSGTLWADTSRRELRDIEFRYEGLYPAADRTSPGGKIRFRTLANGVVLVDQWYLRLPAVVQDTVMGPGLIRRLRAFVRPQESGGIVLSASWPDLNWTAPSGTLVAILRDPAGRPLGGAYARLERSDYAGRADANGVLTIPELLPGPYDLSVVDSAFADLPISVKPVARFEAKLDTTRLSNVVVDSPLDGVVAAFCRNGLAAGNKSVVVGRFKGPDGLDHVPGGTITAEWGPTGPAAATDTSRLTARTLASDAGLFAFCGLPAETPISMWGVWGSDSSTVTKFLTPNGRALIRHDLQLESP